MKFRLRGRTLLAAITTPGPSIRRLVRWFAGGAHRLPMMLAIAAGIAGTIAALIPPESSTTLRRLPTVPMVNLDGSPTTTDTWRGGPMVVNVWATWCPPCRVEMPSLEGLREKLAPDQIRVVALSVDDDQHLVREFMLKHGIDLPVGISISPAEAMSALEVAGIPLTLYVDGDGRVVDRYVGERDWSDKAVVDEVRRKLLGR